MTTPTQRPASNSEGRKRTAEKAEVVHHAPSVSGSLTRCCGVTLFELPGTDRVAFQAELVTCSADPTPAEPDADEREGCPSCDRDLSAPGVSGHECYTYAERAARIASRTPDAYLAATKAEKVARGMERLRAVNPMNGDSSNYMLDRAQRVLVEEFPECRAAIEDERRVAASEREELYERLERENAARAARLREQGGDA